MPKFMNPENEIEVSRTITKGGQYRPKLLAGRKCATYSYNSAGVDINVFAETGEDWHITLTPELIERIHKSLTR